jgi:hypothetical protein
METMVKLKLKEEAVQSRWHTKLLSIKALMMCLSKRCRSIIKSQKFK